MTFIDALYLIGMGVPGILIVVCWWNWIRKNRPKSNPTLFLCGLWAGTAHCALWWGWVVWLRFHNTPAAWEVHELVSRAGFGLLLVSFIAAVRNEGKNAVLLGVSAVVAVLPWIPLGVL